MTRLALALIAALLCFAVPSDAHADSKSKAKAPQKSDSKVTARAPAPAPPPSAPPPPAAPITALPTATVRPSDAPSVPASAGTITTDEARALVAADTAGAVSTDHAPPVDPLSLIEPIRRAPLTRQAPASSPPQALASDPQSVTLFPISAGPLAALLVASLAALALTVVAVRRAGHLHHLLHSPSPDERPIVTSASPRGAVPTRWTGRRFEPASAAPSFH